MHVSDPSVHVLVSVHLYTAVPDAVYPVLHDAVHVLPYPLTPQLAVPDVTLGLLEHVLPKYINLI